MDGQANVAPVSADDLAQFIVDNPDADRAEDTKEQEPPTEDAPLEDTGDEETQDESPDQESPDGQTNARKFKVTVKGEDGADLEQEVDEKELIASYMRHADYTRKTQELARREDQATEVVQKRVSEAQNHFMQQAQLAQAAVMRLAGMRSPEEMQALANTDPAGYVAEQARMNQVQAVIAGLQQQMQQTQFQQQQQQQQEMQKAFQRCWGVIGQKGIDKPKLQRIFDTVSQDYGIPYERFANLSDPALVLMMNDAVAYRDLVKKKAEVTKKSENAPRLPQRQNVPRSDASKRQEDRLRSGKGSRDDLAAFIARNDL